MIWKSCRQKILASNIQLSNRVIELYKREKIIINVLEKNEPSNNIDEAVHIGKVLALSEVLKIIGK